MPLPVPDACPVCGKPSGPGRLRPFCSARCADVDLGRWFTGAYSVPAVEADEDLAEEDAQAIASSAAARPVLKQP